MCRALVFLLTHRLLSDTVKGVNGRTKCNIVILSSAARCTRVTGGRLWWSVNIVQPRLVTHYLVVQQLIENTRGLRK